MHEHFMKEAERIAKTSPCLRRKYGVAIDTPYALLMGANLRPKTHCCNGKICVRDRLQIRHGERIEAGGEIHAEVIALLEYSQQEGYNDGTFDAHECRFYLAGFDSKGEQLLGRDVWPCHYCAMIIQHVGFDNIIIRNTNEELEFVSIYDIIEEHEKTYEPIGTA